MKSTSKVAKALLWGALILFFTFALINHVNHVAAQTCVQPPLGLLGWWPGDGNANDISVGNSGTVQNGTTFAPGKVAQAFSFDGVDDFVDVPDSAILDSITSAITVDMWIKPEVPGTPNAWFFSRRDALVSEGFSIFLGANGGIGVAIRTTTSPSVSGSTLVSLPGVIQFGMFQHVAATADTSTGVVKIFLNGQELPLNTVFGPSTLSGQLFNVNNLFIGRRQTLATGEGIEGAAHYKGLIDEVEIFNRALSEAEILDIFNAGSAGKCKPGAPAAQGQCVPPPIGMVGWWPGDGNPSEIVNSNFGTLQNGATFASGMVGQAFSLDGVDDFVFIGNPASLKITGAIAIDAWINPGDLSEGQVAIIVSKWAQSEFLDSYSLGISKQSGVIKLAGGIGVFGVVDHGIFGGNIQPHTWSHVAMTYDSITGENMLYINGQQVASRVRLGGIVASDQNVLIGREDSFLPRPFPGLIDEVEIYGRNLSTPEIQTIFNAGSAGKCKVLVSITDLQNQLAAANQMIANLNAQIAQLQSQVTTLTQQNAQLQSQVATLTQQNTQLQNQVNQLQANISQLQAQLAAANQTIQTLQNQIAQLQSQLAAANQQIANLQSQLAACQAELAALKAPAAQVKAVIESVGTLLLTAPPAAQGFLQQAVKSLTSAEVALAAGDLDRAIKEIQAALQNLINAAAKGADTAALQRTLVEGVGVRVALVVKGVEAIVGSANPKVQEAKTLLAQGEALLTQGKFKEALDAFQKAREKAAGAG